MFPTGMAGVGLSLRIRRSPLTPGPLSAIGLPAVALCLGLLTPDASSISCLIELVAALRYGGLYLFNLITPGLNTAELGMRRPVVLGDSTSFQQTNHRFPSSRQG
jgi:hypothetical protein